MASRLCHALRMSKEQRKQAEEQRRDAKSMRDEAKVMRNHARKAKAKPKREDVNQAAFRVMRESTEDK